MTSARPPESSRRSADGAPGQSRPAGSSSSRGPNPFDRPLPPGWQRSGAGSSPSASPAPSAPATPAPADANGGGRRRAENRGASGLPADLDPRGRGTGSGRTSAASAGSARGGRGTAIPLMAPPAWQVAELQTDQDEARPVAEPQRGLSAWMGLVVLLALTGIGGLIDAVAGASIKGAFAIGLILGALVAILLVRRSSMFPVVVAPPLVYFAASAVLLYVRSDGLANKAAITDAAASWLVYGFPAIAGASAVVLIVAGVRLILHR